MTFQDQVASDLTNVFFNTDDNAVAATLRVRDATSGGTAVTVTLGDEQQSFEQHGITQDNLRARPMLLQRSVVNTALGRELQRGDQIIIASGEAEGTWLVGTASHDAAAYSCECYISAPHRALSYLEEPL